MMKRNVYINVSKRKVQMKKYSWEWKLNTNAIFTDITELMVSIVMVVWLWFKRVLIEIHTEIFTDKMKSKYKQIHRVFKRKFCGRETECVAATWQLRARSLLRRQGLAGTAPCELSKAWSASLYSMLRKLFYFWEPGKLTETLQFMTTLLIHCEELHFQW